MDDITKDEEHIKEDKDCLKTLPIDDEYRLIKWNDISIKDKDDKISTIPGIEYYVQSMFSGYYHRFVTTQSTNLKEIMPFIKEGLVFIKK
jgi:hypothetical protein